MREYLANREDEILDEIIALTKINTTYGVLCEKALYLQSLFVKKGFSNAVIDGCGNVFVEIPGKNREDVIVVAAPTYSHEENEGVKVTSKSLFGKNIINGFALYTLVILGEFLKKEELENSIYLLAASSGTNEMHGTSFFLKSINRKVKGFIDISGGKYLKVSTASEMTVRLKIDFKSETTYNIKSSPIVAINSYINKVREEGFFENIFYNIGEIKAGNSYSEIPGTGYVKLEMRSGIKEDISEAIEILRSFAKGIEREYNVIISIKEILRVNGIIEKNSLLEENVRGYLREKGFTVSNERWNSEIVYSVENKIDSLSIGIGNGLKRGYDEEELEIKSIVRGILYFLDILLFIDRTL